MTGASSGHITNLKQSILETFNIYAFPGLSIHEMRNDEQLNGIKHAAVFRDILNSSIFFCSRKNVTINSI